MPGVEQVEAHGTEESGLSENLSMEELDNVITKEELGQAQRYDKELRVTGEKAKKKKE